MFRDHRVATSGGRHSLHVESAVATDDFDIDIAPGDGHQSPGPQTPLPGVAAPTAAAASAPSPWDGLWRWGSRAGRSPRKMSLDELRAEVERREQRAPLLRKDAWYAEPTRLERWSRARHLRWSRRQDQERLRRKVATTNSIDRATVEDANWHRRAIAAAKRVASPTAQLAGVHKESTRTSRILICLVLIGLAWSAVNVQRNLVPDNNPADAMFWLSYGIEAMISLPLIRLMRYSATAGDMGVEIEVKKVLGFELGLLSTTIALNVVPHLVPPQDHDQLRAATSAVAPVMVTVVIWIQAWLSAQYGELTQVALDRIAQEPEPELVPEAPSEIAESAIESAIEPAAAFTLHPVDDPSRAPARVADMLARQEGTIPESRDWQAVAATAIECKLTLPRPVEDVARILYLVNDCHWSLRQTAEEFGFGSHDTVRKVVRAGNKVLADGEDATDPDDNDESAIRTA